MREASSRLKDQQDQQDQQGFSSELKNYTVI